jgi:hypothetical protein
VARKPNSPAPSVLLELDISANLIFHTSKMRRKRPNSFTTKKLTRVKAVAAIKIEAITV